MSLTQRLLENTGVKLKKLGTDLSLEKVYHSYKENECHFLCLVSLYYPQHNGMGNFLVVQEQGIGDVAVG